jgi:two-component system response regulator HydG
LVGPLDGTGVFGIYSAEPAIRQHIKTVLAPIEATPRIFKRITDLETSLLTESIPILILVLPADPVMRTIPAEEFGGLMRFLVRLRRLHPASQVLTVTPTQLSLEQIYQIINHGIAGIVDYRQTDFDQRILETVQTALRCYGEIRRRREATEWPAESLDSDGLVGSSLVLRKILDQVRRAARVSDASVIISGESGTGKQRIAELIHKLDPKRRKYAFVCVNCASIAGSLAESELFGHRKGAFTGATEDRHGYFRTAHRGTILLDEISELQLSLQPKILRVLQEGLVLPVGSDKEHLVDVRVIAATNRDLNRLVTEDRFRLDLFQRLNVIHLEVPSLRQRKEDIPALFKSFLQKYAHYYSDSIRDVDPNVYEVLAQTVGSGNVRELENIVRRILVFKQGGRRIELTDLPMELIEAGLQRRNRNPQTRISEELIESLANGRNTLCDVVDAYEQAILIRLLERKIRQTALADRLGITRRTLYNKLRKYNLR